MSRGVRIAVLTMLAGAAGIAPLRAAQPITITFEDIFSKPFDQNLLPPFAWKGVQFSGGALRRTENAGTYYLAQGRNAIELIFPAGSTEISFKADGLGRTTFFTDRMPIEVWKGSARTGTLVATLPRPASSVGLAPPKNEVSIPGSASVITLFSASAPSGIDEVFNDVVIDDVRYTPPDPEPSIQFDAVLAEQAKVLTHNYGAFPFFSPLQTEDGAIRVWATARVNDQPAVGKTIHFRLIDPPDTAPYAVADSAFGDNFDGPGSLNAPGQTTATAVSDAAGRVAVTLRVTSFASGDNYQIEASGTQNFSCGLTCAKSAVYTAWKRVYVEYNKMFRKGAFLTEDVPAGAKRIPVDDLSGLPAPPFTVRLLHAAKVDAPSAEIATEERAVIVKIEKDEQPASKFWGLFSSGPEPGILLLASDPGVPGLQRSYAGPENVKGKIRPYLADAVGVVTGNRTADFLLANLTLMNGPFDPTFTDFVWLTDASASDPDFLFTQRRLSYDGVIPSKLVVGGTELDQYQREWLARKWLQHAEHQSKERVALPNHQALFTLGSFWKTDSSLSADYGVATAASNFSDSWLAVLAMGNANLIGEAAVHELSHQWLVNHGGTNPNAYKGHCGRVSNNNAILMWGQPSRLCTMTADLYQHPDGSDGRAGFHYVKFGGIIDSEFLRIRRRQEPVPQNEQQREPPQ